MSSNQLITSNFDDNMQSPMGVLSAAGIGVFHSNGRGSDHMLQMQPNMTSLSINVDRMGHTEMEQMELHY